MWNLLFMWHSNGVHYFSTKHDCVQYTHTHTTLIRLLSSSSNAFAIKWNWVPWALGTNDCIKFFFWFVHEWVFCFKWYCERARSYVKNKCACIWISWLGDWVTGTIYLYVCMFIYYFYVFPCVFVEKNAIQKVFERNISCDNSVVRLLYLLPPSVKVAMHKRELTAILHLIDDQYCIDRVAQSVANVDIESGVTLHFVIL